MHEKEPITPNEATHENLPMPHVLVKFLDDGCKAMAADKKREDEALEWCNAFWKYVRQ
jgi:hypothetical protein